MAYYLTDHLEGPALSARRPTINEFFLSSYTLAIYDGCELGCPYCDSWVYRLRPLDETIRVPLDLPQRLAQELEAVDRRDLIGITALSDPYQPAEASYRLTRQVLQLFAERGQPCLVMTKSPMVLEDVALLRRINEQSLAIVMVTLLTENAYIADKLEGKVAPPAMRLEMIAELKRAGIPVAAALLPVMPYVNDTESQQRNLLRAIAEAGADFLVWDYLALPNERLRARVSETLARLGSYPSAYYRDLYGQAMVPHALYRREIDRELLERCTSQNLEVRAPLQLYRGKLLPTSSAALLLKQAAFFDAVQGRDRLAAQHRQLAADLYAGQASDEQLRASPLYPTLREILAGAAQV
jgi:DNA repair photolyase